MTQPHTTTAWITHLERATDDLRTDPTLSRAYQAMALARHTAASIARLDTPASALDWIQLVEALTEARDHLSAADPAAAHATIDDATAAGDPSNGVPPERGLADVAPLRQAVTDLVAQTSIALRDLALVADDPQSGLATAVAALALRRVGNWP